MVSLYVEMDSARGRLQREFEHFRRRRQPRSQLVRAVNLRMIESFMSIRSPLEILCVEILPARPLAFGPTCRLLFLLVLAGFL